MQVHVKAACEERLKLETEEGGGIGPELKNESECETYLGKTKKKNGGPGSEYGFDSKYWPDDLQKVPAAWRDRFMPGPDDSIWTLVRAVFTLPWFRRVWIVQDVAGASSVKIACSKWIID